MAHIIDLSLARRAKWTREVIEAVKEGQNAQFRAADLHGREVVVFGHGGPRQGYEPMLVSVDSELGRVLKGFRTTADGRGTGRSTVEVVFAPGNAPNAYKPGSQAWYAIQIDHAIGVLNRLDEGWDAECRYATLGPDAVVVFGLRGGRRFYPAFVCLDGNLKEKLADVRELDFTSSNEEDGPGENAPHDDAPDDHHGRGVDNE